MSDAIPTVKVKRDGPKGYRIINADAFDPKVHERFVDLLDHDRDGKKGGSAADEADALRAKITALGGSFHHKAGVEKLAEQLNVLLDAPHDDADGLSHRELNADLEAKGIAFDPNASPAEKFALLNPAEA